MCKIQSKIELGVAVVIYIIEGFNVNVIYVFICHKIIEATII